MNDDNYIDLYAEDIDEIENFSYGDNGDDTFDLYDDIIFQPTTETALENSNTSSASIVENCQYITINVETTEKDPLDNFDGNSSSNVDKSKSTTTMVSVDDNKESGEINTEALEKDDIEKMPQDDNVPVYQLYVSNLAWWTTEEEIIKTIKNIGVNDLKELKLFETQNTGMSNGYCISIGSQDSMNLCMEVLPKIEIDGQNPIVTVVTEQALNDCQNNSGFSDKKNFDHGTYENYSSKISLPNMTVPPPGYEYNSYQSMQLQPPQYQSIPNWNEPAHTTFSYDSHRPLQRCNMQEPESRLRTVHEAQYLREGPLSSVEQHRISQKELENIIGKNKAVVNLAISRAKEDAKEKNYKSARETLVTAISLIKRSRVAHDARCTLLICSLEDVLNDIMRNKRSRSSSRSRRRSTDTFHSRSRSKENYRNRERSRDRSRRAMDRDYPEFKSRNSNRRHERRGDEKEYRRNTHRATDSDERRYKRER